ncbi:MAG: hypothetical protein ABF713_05945 [Acetobacter orientalis]
MHRTDPFLPKTERPATVISVTEQIMAALWHDGRDFLSFARKNAALF